MLDLTGTPWLITESAFREIEMKSRDAEQVKAWMSFMDAEEPPLYEVVGTVAIISCVGVFSKRRAWWSGPFNVARVRQALNAALKDPAIKSIVFDVESPGGSVAGAMELADIVFAARGKKRIVSVANEMAASSGLWFATSASEFVATPGAIVGSLGVVWPRYDITEANKQMGLTVHLFASAEAKTWGWPETKLSESEKASKQAVCETFFNQFLDGVAKNRGTTREDARNRWGSAETWIGQAAVDIELCDRVATLDQVVSELAGMPISVEDEGEYEDVESNPKAHIRQPGRRYANVLRTTRR